MNNKKPNDPLYPNGFDETPKSTGELPKPTKKDDDLNPLEKLNRKIGVYLSPSTTNATKDLQNNDTTIGAELTSYVASNGIAKNVTLSTIVSSEVSCILRWRIYHRS